MEAKPTTPSKTDTVETNETAPTTDPQKAAGSVNPKQKAPFYAAVSKSLGARKDNNSNKRGRR